MAKIDLHIHTTCSDGELTPFEVIDEAVNNGVKTIAIADHDTTESYTEELDKIDAVTKDHIASNIVDILNFINKKLIN